MTFIGQSTLDIKRKLQHLDKAFGMNSSQLVDIAFKIYHAHETWKLKQTSFFIETVQGNQKERQDLKGKG